MTGEMTKLCVICGKPLTGKQTVLCPDRECHREQKKKYSHKYRQNNLEKTREYGRKYRLKNRERKSERARKYYQKNLEMMRERGREWYHNNLEKTKEYYQNNSEKIKKRVREYRLKNREKIKEYKRKQYQNNREKERERRRKHYQNNREKIKRNSSNQYRRSRGLPEDCDLSQPSSIEIIMKQWLQDANIEFVEQHYINLKENWTKVDFFIEPNICLYSDGDYWHGPENPDVQERDDRINRALEEKGHIVIRLGESDILAGVRPVEILELVQ